MHVELLEDGEFSIGVNHGDPCLWDVPAPLMKGLLGAGICPAVLEELLKTGALIYGA